MVLGVFHLADDDGDGKVTRDEMNSAIETANSEDFEAMMDTLFAGADVDASGELTYDELWGAMDMAVDAGELGSDDAWAIESILEWADAEVGDHSETFSLEEAKMGVMMILTYVQFELGVDEIFASVDMDGDDAISFDELEAVLPSICEM